jgi:hypothetical protein
MNVHSIKPLDWCDKSCEVDKYDVLSLENEHQQIGNGTI